MPAKNGVSGNPSHVARKRTQNGNAVGDILRKVSRHHRGSLVPTYAPSPGRLPRRLATGTAKDTGRLGQHAITVVRGADVFPQLSEVMENAMLLGHLRTDPLRCRAEGAKLVTDEQPGVLQAAWRKSEIIKKLYQFLRNDPSFV
jgi:hypothetical protein